MKHVLSAPTTRTETERSRSNPQPKARAPLNGRSQTRLKGRSARVRSICVYCGSGHGENPVYTKAAHVLGGALAEADIRLVYGGGGLGLMGEVARATLEGGGKVTGIIPDFLTEREQMLRDVSDLIVTQDMHERKKLMFEHSDAFVALPGGIGTLEELVEQLTWAQLGQHSKPIVIANIAEFWSPFLHLLDHMRGQAFIRPGLDVGYGITTEASGIVPLIQTMHAEAGEAEPVTLPKF